MKNLLYCISFLFIFSACILPDPPVENDSLYVKIWGFDLDGGLFRGDDAIACAHPRTSDMCAVQCESLAAVVSDTKKLQAALTETKVCSKESKGAGLDLAYSIMNVSWEVWGFDGEGGIFRGDTDLSCHDPTLVDLCTVQCVHLQYLTVKSKHLKTVLETNAHCSAMRTASLAEFYNAFQMIRTIEKELK